MTWEQGRQLASLQTEDNEVNYKYDSNGMRTQKTDNSGTTYYYYDSDKNLIGLTKGNDTLLFYYDSDGNVTSFKYGNTMYYYVKNLQGDVVKIINQTGTEVATYVYDAWGNIKSATGNTNLKELNPFRYRGYVYDNESGIYYLQSRYYDPITGRFLNADDTAILLLSTIADNDFNINLTNTFTYCYNNPIFYQDNNGFIAGIDDAIIWGLIGLFTITCMLCAWMSRPQFRQAWSNFCNSVGNGLSSIWSTICGGASSVWSWSISKIKKATNALQKFNSIAQADSKIRKIVRKSSKNRYWTAYLSNGYVVIGTSISFEKAKRRVLKGGSVFTVTEKEAYKLAKLAYGNLRPVGPEIDRGKVNALGYYYHYHVYGRLNSAHIWYLYN